MIRHLRIAILLFILLGVIVTTLQSRWTTTAWDEALWVAFYPVKADDSPATLGYIESLSAEGFADIESFLIREGSRYGLTLDDPINIQVRDEVEMPPQPPASGMLQTLWWSLRLRFWAWRIEANDGEPPAHIQIFVVYHDPARQQRVPHSLGLERGLIGIVHAFASTKYRRRNQVVIAHELLHTLGATDKYDLATNQPIFPHGYAHPDKQPRYPQDKAEIMGGRVPLSATSSEMPSRLRQAIIGPTTAREINWLE